MISSNYLMVKKELPYTTVLKLTVARFHSVCPKSVEIKATFGESWDKLWERWSKQLELIHFRSLAISQSEFRITKMYQSHYN